VHCHCATRAYSVFNLGAGEGIRTLDSQLGKLELYQLSYARLSVVEEEGFEPSKCKHVRFTV
jgi:hypothetical protein